MQKTTRIVGFESGKQYETIFFKWSDLKTVGSSCEKKLLRHYLCTIEHLTRDGFFNFHPQEVSISEYGFNKNAFKKLNQLHIELGTLNITKGHHGKNLYSFSDSYPKNMAEWLRCGGYTKIDRGLLKELLKNLSDNELRLYFHLKRVFEYHGSPSLGVETWPKVLRDSLGLTQPTFKKILKSLSEKSYIVNLEPIDRLSRKKNRFVFVLKKICSVSESKELSGSIQENLPTEPQNPDNFVHLKEFRSKTGIKLKQGDKVEKQKTSSEKESDFNFYGLDKLERPLDGKTIKILLELGLSKEVIQESVMRFARYYKSHPSLLHNPVGYLIGVLKKEKVLFVEPEWFLSDFFHGEFKSSRATRKANSHDSYSNRGEILSAQDISSYLKDSISLLDENENHSEYAKLIS